MIKKLFLILFLGSILGACSVLPITKDTALVEQGKTLTATCNSLTQAAKQLLQHKDKLTTKQVETAYNAMNNVAGYCLSEPNEQNVKGIPKVIESLGVVNALLNEVRHDHK